ncbi:hypothetical protein NA57DRAFT_60807 [Rhizodiscina lignyota]|uniref:Uncharacterized protein n=1 Tax=Rhizodiscina lignyota TaxID=1504668 RepID=A0A9P4I8V5_9PEZI|nr:hypothetical protein NA57DRAFT_60807 [Rhizodiscina lignyota]
MASNIQSSPEYQTLLQDLSNSNVTAAAQTLAAPATTTWNNGGSESDVENDLWNAWNAVIALAQNTDDDAQQNGLVAALQAFQQLGQLTRDDGTVCQVWNATVWTDLPVFGGAMREQWNPPSDPSQAASWTNLNAFAARSTASEYKPNTPFDFALYAIWTNRDALESTAAASKDYASIPASALQAAAQWFIYCSPTLLRESTLNGGRSFDGKTGIAGAGYSGKDWTGLTTDRWILWKENMQAIIASGQQQAENDLLQKAVSSMEFAEQQSG